MGLLPPDISGITLWHSHSYITKGTMTIGINVSCAHLHTMTRYVMAFYATHYLISVVASWYFMSLLPHDQQVMTLWYSYSNIPTYRWYFVNYVTFRNGQFILFLHNLFHKSCRWSLSETEGQMLPSWWKILIFIPTALTLAIE